MGVDDPSADRTAAGRDGRASDESVADRASRAAPASRSDVSFTLAGLKRGYVTCIPVAAGVAGYGVVFGMLARQAGLSVVEAAVMSATVLAGAAQLLVAELWATASPTTIVLATVLVNLRYLLLSASLQPWFRHLTRWQAYLSVFFTADENWALTMNELTDGSNNGAFLLGSGLTIWSFWVAATVAGASAGGAIGSPARFGLDFVFVAVFLGIAVSLWDGRSDAVPWLVALATSLVGARLLPGQWYILLGGLAGSFARGVRYDG